MTTVTPAGESPPILPVGFHRLRLEELRVICVDRFPGSATRQAIMSGLEQVIARLVGASLGVEVWVDGSFLTTKTDPQDVDIVLKLPIEAYEQGSNEQRDVLEWIRSNRRADHLCDSYVFFVFPDNDERAVLNDYNHAYWIRQFGFSRGQDLKGIAILHTGALS